MLRSGVAIWPAFTLTMDLRDLPLVLTVGAVLLAAQVVLSRRREWWPGLILPGVWLGGTLADLIPQAVRSGEAGWGWMGGTVEALVTALAIENIPTLVLLAVYAACCFLRRRRLRRQLRKTQIDDI